MLISRICKEILTLVDMYPYMAETSPYRKIKNA
jgi:hypothetical protein